jgi:site-specific DNA recombinase
LQARLEGSRASTNATTDRLRGELSRQLTRLEAQEDRYLDLVGDPDWPKEKLAAKIRKKASACAGGRLLVAEPSQTS